MEIAQDNSWHPVVFHKLSNGYSIERRPHGGVEVRNIGGALGSCVERPFQLYIWTSMKSLIHSHCSTHQ